ncbi:MAG TPA: cysteine desulfurase family protein [Propionibacteriaceae bacterium]|nr:cysteine desulfurase family protein [Propionibacteriaceae bacterium]
MSDPTQPPVYLDHNGTAPVAPEVADAMWPYLTEHFGNPSSLTPQGRAAREAVEAARERVAALVGAHPDEIVFTSGGTESNNLAIRGSAASASVRVALSSVVEHPATVQPLTLLEQDGWTVHRMPVDAEGRVAPASVPHGPIGLGTLILAQNEVGTVEPVAAIAERVHAAGGVMHADAAQAVGKIPVDVGALGVDLLSIAGHKLYAPKGVGALVVRRGTPLRPVLVGAGQERGLRPGTENVASIVGLGAAAELAGRVLADEPARQERLRELLWQLLSEGIPGLVRVSSADGCLPNTLMVAVPDRTGADLLEAAPAVAASTGSACHAGVHTPAATLLAMGVDPRTAVGAVRLTLGRSTARSDVVLAAEALVSAARR